MLTNYVFWDEFYEKKIEEAGLHDDEVAEKHAERLSKRLNTTVRVLAEVCIVAPAEKEQK